jgi:hypothetical protein
MYEWPVLLIFVSVLNQTWFAFLIINAKYKKQQSLSNSSEIAFIFLYLNIVYDVIFKPRLTHSIT